MAFKPDLLGRFLLIVFFALVLCAMARGPLLKGGPAPLFELKSVEGQMVNLSELKGEFVVLNFWATWCAPCIKEMPELQKAHHYLEKEGVKILAINLGEKLSRIEKFIEENQLNFPVLLDSFGNTSEKYRVMSLPVTYFITPDGILRDEMFGGGLTREIIEAKVNQYK